MKINSPGLDFLKVIIILMIIPLFLLTGSTISRAEDGKSSYEAYCEKCHGGGFGGVFSRAPKTGDAEVWKSLLAKGTDKLKQNANNGFGRMKARGGCDNCTEEQVNAAVDYMVSQAQ